MKNRMFRLLSTLLLAYSLFFVSLPVTSLAQATAVRTEQDLSASLATIEAKLEAWRKELGIPGMSLAIVKDDKVIYSKGLGYKDFENKIAATADTQFAIGSSTKAFTALSVLMSVDEGKFSLDDSPKKVLPYFKMADPDTDKNMTIRDLLTHSSGLNRTDIAMITGKLSRQQLIRVAGEAKPIGKLREKFGYQNLMFATAGEVVAVAQKQPWEKFVPERIFKPLGMTNSNMSVAEMEKAKDRSFGYNYNFDTKETERLAYRNIDQVGPAGSINSSSNDMAKWLRFVLAGGVIEGKRLVSKAGFDEWLEPQMKVDPAGNVNYAMGWFVQKWNGHTVIQHGGNIDGFNAMVAMIPDKKLGFVMLTNVSGSSLGNELMPIVFENIIGRQSIPETLVGADVPSEKEAGKYRFEAGGIDLDIQWNDSKLTAVVPGQPTYVLERIGARKYKMGGAPEGFFITFRDKELFLEQPQGSFTLPRVESRAAEPPANVNGMAAKDLIGKYTSETSGRGGEVREQDGTIVFVVGTQPPVSLVEKAKDQYWMKPLPDTYWISVKRTNDGKIEKIGVNQPEGEFFFKPGSAPSVGMTADELMAKVIEASGGEANLKKLNSRVSIAEIDLEQQGVRGIVTTWSKAPGKTATETKFTALEIEIATGWDYFDGAAGEQAYSFAPVSKYTGKRLDDMKLSSDFYSMLDWKSKFKKVSVDRIAKCGDEECYVVEFEPNAGSKFTDYYSTKTLLLVRRDGTISSSTSSVQIPHSTTFSDYREVDGVKIPFKSVNNTAGNGDIVTVVKSVKHNVKIEDSFFAPRKSSL